MSFGFLVRSGPPFLATPSLQQRVDAAGARPDVTNAFQIFGMPDDLKFRSCMTLFSHAVPDEPIFKRALAKYFGGLDDPRTMEWLSRP